ncbi:MAG TPA: asparagine synthase (glutamine-hydrolyzing) [Kiritimatiellia bacterium]|nr:asparagine synthase (glutamine-hydrolyzing) [Kiritimatiellia bacterium]
MCGIAGIWHRDGQPVDEHQLHTMIDTLHHRGRDDHGIWCQHSLGLAHRRLSIIDLSTRGHQPMHAGTHPLHLTFNGEIHNYLELRDQLTSLGHTFHTCTDTEVILHAYAQWGQACFPRFNGMWALALWDEANQELILSRDRFGIKPLVYAILDHTLYFASEPKALLAADPRLREPNYQTLHHYLRAMVTDIGPDTFFRHIHAIPSGHTLRITPRNIQSIPHWTFQPRPETPHPQPVETFHELLSDAVNLRLRSDAPLGIWLSGGLDSSTIAALAATQSDRPLTCFSMHYPHHPRFDESHYIRSVARHIPNLHIHWVTPPPTSIIETIADIVHAHDAPTVVRGRYASWTLARETARHVNVVLSGDGADELLGGYQTFAAPYALDRLLLSGPGLTRNPRHIRREYDQLVTIAQPGLSARDVMLRGLKARLGILCGALPMITPPGFTRTYGPANPHHHYAAWASYCGQKPFRSLLNNSLWREFTWRGLPEMMKAFDAVTMAHTLEIRSPFLDHRIVEFCFSLPYYEKIRHGLTKHLLRRAAQPLLPPDVLQRRHKLGFPSPLHNWFAEPKNLTLARDYLLNGHAASARIFDPHALQSALHHLATHETFHNVPRHILLWAWISVEAWLRQTQPHP